VAGGIIHFIFLCQNKQLLDRYGYSQEADQTVYLNVLAHKSGTGPIGQADRPIARIDQSDSFCLDEH
jgi:hypothetical protein